MFINSQAVIKRMAELGLRQIDLACRSGISTGTIQRVLKGANRPNPRTIGRLAKGLEVDVNDIILAEH